MGRKKQKSETRSQRQLKMGEMIRHALSDIFLRVEICDPELDGVILTVSEVRVSPDGRKATVYVSPLANENRQEIVKALVRHQKFLRGELALRIHLKFVPELFFELDAVFDQAEEIDRLLRSDKVVRDI